MPRTVLIIDDDIRLIELLTEYLKGFDYAVLSATHPEAGLVTLRKKKPELVILDVMLPGKSGFDVCREIRRESQVPIIMLTARGEVADRIVGLELGADDYLSKPFEPRELVARMATVLRRGNGEAPEERMVFGPLVINTTLQRAELAGVALDLTTSEYEVLLLFAGQPGRTFNRDQIMDRLRGTDWSAFNRSIDVLISRLRQKLGDEPKAPRFIRTVWGSGYVFVGKRGAAEEIA